jgi:hypothetical protein
MFIPQRNTLTAAIVALGILAGWWGWRTWRAYAQSPDAYIVRVYLAGDSSSYQVYTFPRQDVTCDLPSYVGSLPVLDPRKLEWADRQHVGRACVWSDFNKLRPAPGDYCVTLATVTNGLTSDESACAPFVITQGPTTEMPAGLKVYR